MVMPTGDLPERAENNLKTYRIRAWAKQTGGLPGENSHAPRAARSSLSSLIEGEIIPRLFLAHQEAPESAQDSDRGASQSGPACLDSKALADLLLSGQMAEIMAHVQALMDQGTSLERIYLDLLAPAARSLGALWDNDLCSFTDVTIGLTRLHHVLYELGRRAGDSDVGHSLERRRAFFAPCPGEHHTLGLSMVEELFVRAGWETSSDRSATEQSILQVAATEDLDLIGFSVSCKEFLEALSALIEKTREVSRNPGVAIMVGSGEFLGQQPIATKLHPALVVSDPVQAVKVAEALPRRAKLFYRFNAT